MKQYLYNAGLALVTGIFLALGAILATSIFNSEADDVKYISLDYPDGFRFIDHQQLKNVAEYTVEGIVKNDSDTHWEKIGINIDLYAGDAYIMSCKRGIQQFEPNSQRNFRISCNKVSSNVPNNFYYKIEVYQATRVRL